MLALTFTYEERPQRIILSSTEDIIKNFTLLLLTATGHRGQLKLFLKCGEYKEQVGISGTHVCMPNSKFFAGIFR